MREKTFTFDFNLNAWIRGLEIEADSYEEALEKFKMMSFSDIALNGYAKDFEVSDVDVEYEEQDDDEFDYEDDYEDDEY